MKAIGIVLVILGIVGLVYGGITWTRKDKVVDVGPVEITADKKESIPLPPIVGGVMLVAGVVLLLKKPR
jgi:uncharacterized membrane protein YidH (DUF202 family)